jgi:hypothetical protein
MPRKQFAYIIHLGECELAVARFVGSQVVFDIADFVAHQAFVARGSVNIPFWWQASATHSRGRHLHAKHFMHVCHNFRDGLADRFGCFPTPNMGF